MVIKGIIDEDLINYKKPCMVIEMPYCSFKCDKECGLQVCQNSSLANTQNINISTNKLIERYINNDITKAVCFQGLEPFDSFEDLFSYINILRNYYNNNDDIIIYSGYNKDEIIDNINILKQFPNIIIKFGRFTPNQKSHYDEILGVNLASDNQYAERIS
jgi:hypothetical protein